MPSKITKIPWDDRSVKQKTREWVADYSKKEKRVGLLFPAAYGLDIQTLQSKGVFTPRTKLHLVEMYRDVMADLKAQEANIFKPGVSKPTYHQQRMHTIPLETLPNQLDFIWFDGSCNPSYDELAWYTGIRDRLVSPDSDVFHTFSAESRTGNATLMRDLRVLMDGPLNREFKKLVESLGPVKMWSIKDGVKLESTNDPTCAARKLVFLNTIFDPFKFKVHMLAYHGWNTDTGRITTPMLLFHLYGFERRLEPYFATEALAEVFEKRGYDTLRRNFTISW